MIQFEERISINGLFITSNFLNDKLNTIRPIVEEMDKNSNLTGMTEFEIMTVVAFFIFTLIRLIMPLSKLELVVNMIQQMS